jgi:hypothetical protein
VPGSVVLYLKYPVVKAPFRFAEPFNVQYFWPIPLAAFVVTDGAVLSVVNDWSAPIAVPIEF